MSSTKWANIEDDAGALYALLGHVAEHFGVEQVDQLWIFPPRPVAAGDSIVIVVSAFDEDDERRGVNTAHFTVARNRRGVATVKSAFVEHASAPTAALPRVVDGVLRRLGEEVGAEPREEPIHGDPEVWSSLIRALGGRLPEDAADATEQVDDPVDADIATNTDIRTDSDTTSDAGITFGP